MRVAAMLLLTIGVISVPAPATAGPASKPLDTIATVVRVIDAQTFRVRVGGTAATVRLAGVQVPTPCDCDGFEARDEVRVLVLPGDTVRLQGDPALPRTDAHGRLLAYMRPVHGADMGLDLLRAGDARVDRSRPFARLTRYEHAERTARAANRGLWFCVGEARTADLSVAATAPSSLELQEPFTVTATVTNAGPGPARLLVLTSTPSFFLTSISWSPSSFAGDAGVGCLATIPVIVHGPFDVVHDEIRCTAPYLMPGQTWQVQVGGFWDGSQFNFLGTVGTTLTIASCRADPDEANNTATATMDVMP